jgi:hypothetical protein
VIDLGGGSAFNVLDSFLVARGGMVVVTREGLTLPELTERSRIQGLGDIERERFESLPPEPRGFCSPTHASSASVSSKPSRRATWIAFAGGCESIRLSSPGGRGSLGGGWVEYFSSGKSFLPRRVPLDPLRSLTH